MSKRNESKMPARTAKSKHHPSVHRYRTNTTDKCLNEIAAAKSRIQSGMVVGSREYMIIGPACDRSCGAKYHWCPTCFLAPRCDCMFPHFSPYGAPPDQKWYVDQMSAVRRLGILPCDNRYWAMTNEISAAAIGESSKFCEACASTIRSSSSDIINIGGRTYLELAHHIWNVIGTDICPKCVNIIDSLECEYSGITCPSAGVPLINSRLVEYQSRKYARSHKTTYQNYTPAIKPETPRNELIDNDESPDSHDDESCESSCEESSDESSPKESFKVLPGIISSVFDDEAPMLLASQLMDLWFPESDDDAPLGSAVSAIS